VPDVGPFRALDDELVKVGRGCVSAKARLLAENIRHQFCMRRKGTMAAVYQAGETEVITPTRYGTKPHEWRYPPGYNTRWIRVSVLTLGATTSSTKTDESRLNASTTTDAGGDFAHVAFAAAPTTTLSAQVLLPFTKILQVDAIFDGGASEDVIVTQGGDSARTLVRILAVVIEEMPAPSIDTTVDTWALPETQWTPGTDIIDTEYDDLPVAMQTLRRQHKKVLFSLNKECITTSTAFVDLVAGRDGGGGVLRFDIATSVNRPETSGVAVTCRVFAEDTVATNGTVRFAFSGGNIDVINITNTGPAWYGATGTIAELTDTLSIQGDQAAAGTLTVYAVEVLEDAEAA